MGLDMYLYKDTFIGASFRNVGGVCNITVIDPLGKIKDIKGIKTSRIESVRESLGYWHKANAIHYWFIVRSETEDNCQETHIEYADIKALHDLCVEVLKDPSKAEELLPTQEGFFFGSTEYGSAYFDDLRDTVKICDECFKEPDGTCFTYQASW